MPTRKNKTWNPLDLVAVCKIKVSSDKGKTYEIVNFLGAVKRTASKRTSARWP